MDLPPGTDSINVPRLKAPTKVAPQTADAAAVESKDFTDEAVQANVKTLAGQEDVAIQSTKAAEFKLDYMLEPPVYPALLAA